MKIYQPVFSDKGVDIYVSHKQEWIQHGPTGHFGKPVVLHYSLSNKKIL